MAEVTVRQLAKQVGMPVDRLLAQLRESGLPHNDADEPINDQDKRQLSMHLRGLQGAAESQSPARGRTLGVKRPAASKAVGGASAAAARTGVLSARGRAKPAVRIERKRSSGTAGRGRVEQHDPRGMEARRALVEEAKRHQRQLDDTLRAEAEVREKAETFERAEVVERRRREIEEKRAEALRQEEEEREAARLREQAERDAEEAARKASEEEAARKVAEEEAARSEAERRAAEAVAQEQVTGAEGPAPSREAEPRRSAREPAETAPKSRKEEREPGEAASPGRRGRGSRAAAAPGDEPGAGRTGRRGKSGRGRGEAASADDVRSAGRRRSGKSGRERDELDLRPSKGGFERPTAPVVREVSIPETITVGDLAQGMSMKATDLIKAMMKEGIMATINQVIDQDTASLLVEEMGHKPKLVSENSLEDVLMSDAEPESDMAPRPPVVTVMGPCRSR